MTQISAIQSIAVLSGNKKLSAIEIDSGRSALIGFNSPSEAWELADDATSYIDSRTAFFDVVILERPRGEDNWRIVGWADRNFSLKEDSDDIPEYIKLEDSCAIFKDDGEINAFFDSASEGAYGAERDAIEEKRQDAFAEMALAEPGESVALYDGGNVGPADTHPVVWYYGKTCYQLAVVCENLPSEESLRDLDDAAAYLNACVGDMTDFITDLCNRRQWVRVLDNDKVVALTGNTRLVLSGVTYKTEDSDI